MNIDEHCNFLNSVLDGFKKVQKLALSTYISIKNWSLAHREIVYDKNLVLAIKATKAILTHWLEISHARLM